MAVNNNFIYKVNNKSVVSSHLEECLKVPKRENFSLAFFTLSEPIWVGDLGIAKIIRFFITLPLISMVFVFYRILSVP